MARREDGREWAYRVDPYGFERPEDFDYASYEAFFSRYLVVLTRRAIKWSKLLKGSNSIQKSLKVKRYIRKGIPNEHRALVWMIVSGAQANMEQNPGYYHRLLEGEKNAKLLEAIKTDMNRTFPDNVKFRKTADPCLQHTLYNVLVAYGHHNKAVGYCQGMNFIAGYLILITKNEEESFWLLDALIGRILPGTLKTQFFSHIGAWLLSLEPLNAEVAWQLHLSLLQNSLQRKKLMIPTEPQGYTAVQGRDIDEEGVHGRMNSMWDAADVALCYAQAPKLSKASKIHRQILGLTDWAKHTDYYSPAMLGLKTDQEVLGELVKMKVPAVAELMERHGVMWTLVVSRWFICLFIDILPVETVLRIWDCLFYEGSKIIFRVALTLIKQNQAFILEATNFPDICDKFKQITKGTFVTECHTFMQKIFTDPGSLSMATINKLRETCREKLLSQG